jgi:sporulation protein YlmC with PRC-barrel domain
MLNEEELVSFSDLLKVKVYDGKGMHVGHVQDMGIDRDLTRPTIGYLGVHLLWTDKIGPLELVRPVEDVVVLLDWGEVADFSHDAVKLKGVHPGFNVVSAAGKWLIRGDILDKQMLDSSGSRIQRVDDVMLGVEGSTFHIAGLQVSKGLLWTSSKLKSYITELCRKYTGRPDSDVIPWGAIQCIDNEAVVIGERVT